MVTGEDGSDLGPCLLNSVRSVGVGVLPEPAPG